MSARRDRPERGDVVTWSSDQRLPLVGSDGQAPPPVLVALETAMRHPGSSEAIRAANYVRAFLLVTCDELADSRTQVLEDRAELDAYRNAYGPLEREHLRRTA